MSHVQGARKNHNKIIVSGSFGSVPHFRYLITTLKHRYCVLKEIKWKLNSENSCYHSVQNFLSYRLKSRNMKIKIWRNINLLLLLYGSEIWSHIE